MKNIILEEFYQHFEKAVSEDRFIRIVRYFDLLLEYNEKVNLIAKGDRQELFMRHIYDILLSLPHFSKNKSVVDIGTGGGLPGIVLALALDCEVTLVESKHKKGDFLYWVIDELKIKNVKVENKNAQEVFGGFDVITARGFGSIKKIISVSKNMVHAKSQYLLYKGRRDVIDDEIKELSGRTLRDFRIIPLDDIYGVLGERHLVRFQL